MDGREKMSRQGRYQLRKMGVRLVSGGRKVVLNGSGEVKEERIGVRAEKVGNGVRVKVKEVRRGG